MQENEIALPIGSTLQEYKIESILGIGGFGITYLALDIHLNKKVVIKEFLPNDIAVRKDSDTVVPKSHSDQENFEWGMSRFLLEAQTLATFNHPNIVKISRFFQANNTAYFVMDYEEGEDLQTYLERHNKTLSEEDIYNIIMPILDGLREVHTHNFLHRDIKPGNIFIRKNGSPMLIDFGASRFAMGAKSKSLSVVLTEGYAPKEQYSSTSKQGAYTDIYAIGAVMYKMATGKTPIEASARVNATSDDEPDPYKKLQEQNIPYSENFKKAVDWCMELSAKNRPQSVKELQSALVGKKEEDNKKKPKEKKLTPQPKESKQEEKVENTKSIVDISLFVLLVVSLHNSFIVPSNFVVPPVTALSVVIFYFIVLKKDFNVSIFIFVVVGFIEGVLHNQIMIYYINDSYSAHLDYIIFFMLPLETIIVFIELVLYDKYILKKKNVNQSNIIFYILFISVFVFNSLYLMPFYVPWIVILGVIPLFYIIYKIRNKNLRKMSNENKL